MGFALMLNLIKGGIRGGESRVCRERERLN